MDGDRMDARRRVLGEVETSAGTVEEVQYAAGLCLGRHVHGAAHLIYTIVGEHWSGFSRGSDDTCAPRTARYVPVGEPHQNYFPRESLCLHVELKDSFLKLAAEHSRTVHEAGRLPQHSSLTLGARLEREYRRKDDLSRLDLEAVLLELLLAEQSHSARRALAPQWLLQIQEMLHEERGARVTLAELSLCVGRHPVQISRQFHRHFGCTISEYTRRVRIGRAQRMLACRDLAVSEIALACGFFDQSHFTTAFRRLTGMPPRQFRMQVSDTPRN